ncbi:MAG: hypothetical protein WC756_00220 [Taibaiella sp.]|jgi:hypothetical protein
MYIQAINGSIKDPNICPHCHVTINPNFRWSAGSNDMGKNPILITIWGCTNKECNRIFIVKYLRDSSGVYVFKRFIDGLPKGPVWPEPILKLRDGSDNQLPSKFITTYLQSLDADHFGLNEIAGMGYRKAIEYLVKDWAIQNNSSEQESILKLWLGDVIKKYYDGELKGILERATWLGNDQAHYNKLFEEYDISILKELIDLIMVELDRQHKMQHYLTTIQGRK